MANKKNIPIVHDEIKWPYGKNNYIVFSIAMVVIIIGYFLLSKESITVAPILLVIGYLVLIPISLLIKDKSIDENTSDSETAEISE